MNLPIRLAVIAVAACLCLSEGAPDSRILRSKQRPTRGFKAVEMMTARGFGKRDRPSTRAELYGEDNFLDTLESSPQKEQAESEEKPFESVPIEWFVNELLNNQEFARSVVKKFIDVNQDGVLSTEELLRNPA